MAKGVNKIPEIIKEMKDWRGIKGKVGVLGDGEMATIAAVHEFGTRIKVTDAMRGYLGSQGLHLKKETSHIVIPERSYLRSTMDDQKTADAMTDSMKQAMDKNFDGRKAISAMCATAVGRIQRKINSGVAPALSDFTKQQKGSGVSLNDTGRLKQSITYEVVG